MSFLGFGRPQPSSAEKIAAVENEMKLVFDMQNRYILGFLPLFHLLLSSSLPICASRPP